MKLDKEIFFMRGYEKVFYIHEGMPYVLSENIYLCGCGEEPEINFGFDYQKGEFLFGEVYCKKCGITTGVRETLEEAVKVWKNCFYSSHQHREFCSED
jgi:hypothetical protein